MLYFIEETYRYFTRIPLFQIDPGFAGSNVFWKYLFCAFHVRTDEIEARRIVEGL